MKLWSNPFKLFSALELIYLPILFTSFEKEILRRLGHGQTTFPYQEDEKEINAQLVERWGLFLRKYEGQEVGEDHAMDDGGSPPTERLLAAFREEFVHVGEIRRRNIMTYIIDTLLQLQCKGKDVGCAIPP